VVVRIQQVLADDTVFLFTQLAAPLALHAGRLGALLGTAHLIEQGDAVGTGMVADDEPLQALAQAVVVPVQQRQELLQRAGRHVGGQGQGFDALAGLVGQQAAHVHRQMAPGIATAEAVVELGQVAVEQRLPAADSLRIHASASKSWRTRSLRHWGRENKVKLAL